MLHLCPIGYFNSATGQLESHSALFDGSTGYLSFTPSGASLRKEATISVWQKLGDIGGVDNIVSALAGGANDRLRWDSGSAKKLQVQFADSVSGELKTTATFNDASGWYHFLLSIDTTQATASERVKLWVNGMQITAFDTASYPAQNYNLAFGNTVLHTIARASSGATQYSDDYFAETALLFDKSVQQGDFSVSDFYAEATIKSLASLNPDHLLRFVRSSIDNSGTAIGNLTTGTGGLDAAFDGVDSGSQSSINTAYGSAVSPAAEIGRNWSEPKTVHGYRIKAPSNIGFQYQGRTITVKLRGSDDGSSWTDLHSDTFVDAVALEKIYTSGIDVSTSYTYHQAWIQFDTSGRDYQVAELELYTAENPSINLGANSGSEGDWTVNGNVEHTSDSTENNGPVFTVYSGGTLSNGNRSFNGGGTHGARVQNGTTSDKFYFEAVAGSTATIVGVTNNVTMIADGVAADGVAGVYGGYSGFKIESTTRTSSTDTWTATERLRVAFDPVSGDGWLGDSSGWFGSGDPENGTNPWFNVASPSGTWYPCIHDFAAATAELFGTEARCVYTIPTGFITLEGKNDPSFNTPATVS